MFEVRLALLRCNAGSEASERLLVKFDDHVLEVSSITKKGLLDNQLQVDGHLCCIHR